jgi:hypothetical protein
MYLYPLLGFMSLVGLRQWLTSAPGVAGHSTAVATVATVAAAMQSSWGDKNKKPTKDSCLASPTAWFVVDDPVTCTRFFVIQGSDNFDHWRLNLTFDPVAFEDAELGVKVCPAVITTQICDSPSVSQLGLFFV